MLPDYQPLKANDGTPLVCVCCNREVNICVECGAERRSGDWPQCPHKKGIFGEEPMESYYDEHISETGEVITTRGQRSRLMSKGHLEFRPNRFRTNKPVFFFMGKSGG